MNPIYEKVPLIDSSFLMKKESFSYYEIPWHVHPEYELALITKTEGFRHIGDSLSEVEGDNLIFLGPNLPHAWESKFRHDKKSNVTQIIIQFSSDFLGKELWVKPEFEHISKVLKRANKGLEIGGEAREKITRIMYRMLKMGKFRRIIELFKILDILAAGKEFKTLSTATVEDVGSGPESQRVNIIYDFVLQNFQEKCTVPMVASHFGMTPQSFCRYFKSRTKKTFISFLNEIRISHACKLLASEDLSIIEVCYNSGFESLSNFNRQFKKTIHITPREYKEENKFNF